MARFSGMNGSVTWAAGYDTGVKSFDITVEVDVEKYIDWDSADDFENALNGPKRWSGTITCNFDTVTALPAIGASGAATLRAAAATQTWSGTIVCQQITNTVEMSGAAVEATFTFIGDGTLVHPDGT